MNYHQMGRLIGFLSRICECTATCCTCTSGNARTMCATAGGTLTVVTKNCISFDVAIPEPLPFERLFSDGDLKTWLIWTGWKLTLPFERVIRATMPSMAPPLLRYARARSPRYKLQSPRRRR